MREANAALEQISARLGINCDVDIDQDGEDAESVKEKCDKKEIEL